MKVHGIRRPIDNVGRVSIPKEFRDELKWNTGDDVEIFLVDGGILVKTTEASTADIDVSVVVKD